MSTSDNARTATVAMTVGLALTVIVATMPFLGSPTGQLISQHLKTGYPSYTATDVTSATTTYLIGLTLISVLGVGCWLVSIAATHARSRSAPWLATTAFVVAVSVGLFDLTTRDTSGDTGLPALIGWLGLVPCVPGLIAVVLLWVGLRAGRSVTGPSHRSSNRRTA